MRHAILDRFPKQRPPLPEAIQAIYAESYKANREGASHAASLAQRVEGWLHRQVARDLHAPQTSEISTLEIGAGTLNQLPHEPVVGPYDIVEPFESLYRDSPRLPRIRHVYGDIHEVPAHQRYDRITSIAAFEHICNLPEVIARAGVLLETHGKLRVSIPSEGTPLWALGWRLTTGLEFRLKHGLDWGAVMRHEHVNTAEEIETLLKLFFGRVGSRLLGISRYLSLYRFYECSQPNLRRCEDLTTASAGISPALT